MLGEPTKADRYTHALRCVRTVIPPFATRLLLNRSPYVVGASNSQVRWEADGDVTSTGWGEGLAPSRVKARTPWSVTSGLAHLNGGFSWLRPHRTFPRPESSWAAVGLLNSPNRAFHCAACPRAQRSQHLNSSSEGGAQFFVIVTQKYSSTSLGRLESPRPTILGISLAGMPN